MAQSRFLPYLVLLAGVFIAATSSILARLAQADGQGAPSMVIASWRLVIAAFIITPIALRGSNKAQLLNLRRRDLTLAIAAGVLLAAHLATWISSLEYTSVASAAALEKLITDPALEQRMAKAARARFDRDFDIKVTEKRLHQRITGFLAGKAKA